MNKQQNCKRCTKHKSKQKGGPVLISYGEGDLAVPMASAKVVRSLRRKGTAETSGVPVYRLAQ